MSRSRAGLMAALCVVTAGCWSPEPPAEGGSFRFAVFGDGPYGTIETGRAERVFAELAVRPLEFVIHVGDIMWQRCTDDAYRARRAFIERIGHPVVYTPGDNEWSDCVDIPFGSDDPLARLASLRATFFSQPDRSLGAMPIALESQAGDPVHGEFVEHARWSYGGVSFVTVHVVGDLNGGRAFPGREPRHDEEVARRTQAAIDWLYESFEAAVSADAVAVVVAMHANPLYQPGERERAAYSPIEEALVELAQHFGKPVLIIHGDEHRYIADRPFRDPVTGAPVENLQRLETFGSPDIGWVDVVVDTALPEPFRFEPNVTPRWMWW
jgi:hypothetical protein